MYESSKLVKNEDISLVKPMLRCHFEAILVNSWIFHLIFSISLSYNTNQRYFNTFHLQIRKFDRSSVTRNTFLKLKVISGKFFQEGGNTFTGRFLHY